MKSIISISSIVTALIVVINISFFNFLGQYYFYYFGVILLFYILFSKKVKCNSNVALIVFFAFLSIILNGVSAVFRPYERLVIFIVILIICSPLVRSNILDEFRLQLFKYLNIFIVIAVVFSFLGYVTGVYNGVYGRSDYAGFFSHSMILGPMSAISMLLSLFLFFSNKGLYKRSISLVVFIISFLTCILAGSRIALIGFLPAVLFLMLKFYAQRVSKALILFVILFSVIVLSYPYWERYTESIMGKMSYSQTEGSLLSSREVLWKSRLEEFKLSPIIGIGFASIDLTSDDRFNPSNVKIEPGSSWLAVLSMTGLLGFVTVLFFFGKNLKRIFLTKIVCNPNISIQGAIFIFLIVHMFAEGYIFSGGSGLCFYLWLSTGILDVKKNDF